MNEKIQELAGQARLWAEEAYKKQNDQFTSHWDNPIGYTPSQFFEQKFAELIVRECTSCCDIVGRIEWIEPPTYELAIKASKQKIKQHFGVEE